MSDQKSSKKADPSSVRFKSSPSRDEGGGERIDAASRKDRPASRGMQRWRSLSRLVGSVQAFQDTPIKVFCRVRPFLARELQAGGQQSVVVRDGKHLTLHRPTHPDLVEERTFSSCFWSFDTEEELKKGGVGSQDDVFHQAVQPMVDSAFGGYDTTLIAYGSTGSGKSYTIFGGKARKIGPAPDFRTLKIVKTRGVIGHLADDLMKRLSDKKEQAMLNDQEDASFTANISFLEIYNEQIRDLLAPEQGSRNLKLREYPNLGLYIEGLTKHSVGSSDDFHRLLALGMKSRTVLRTKLSEESSRAHTIITINLNLEAEDVMAQLPADHEDRAGIAGSGTGGDVNVNLGTDYRTSKMTIVDLAGTERSDQRGARRANVDRLKEAMAINKSLLALNRVIRELWLSAKNEEEESSSKAKKKGANAAAHSFGYRDSVLTRVLHESFGGNCRTTLIATLSPADLSLDQTLQTVQYADMSQLIMNKPRVNRNSEFRALNILHAEVAVLKRKEVELKLAMKSLVHANEIQASNAMLLDVITQIEERQFLIEELETPPEIRAERAREMRTQFELELQKLGVGVREGESDEELRKTVPHLVQLTDDSTMGTLVYFLREDATLRFGSKNGASASTAAVDVVLFGIGIEPEHCSVHHNSATSVVTLAPLSPSASICVNGTTISERIELETGDRVVLGTTYFFRFVNPITITQTTTATDGNGNINGSNSNANLKNIKRSFTFSRARAVTLSGSNSQLSLPGGEASSPLSPRNNSSSNSNLNLAAQLQQKQRDSIEDQRERERIEENENKEEKEKRKEGEQEEEEEESEPLVDEDEYDQALKELHYQDIDKMAEAFTTSDSEDVPEKLFEQRELVKTMENDYFKLVDSLESIKESGSASAAKIRETEDTIELLLKSLEVEKEKLLSFEELVRDQVQWETHILDVLAKAFPQVHEANSYATMLEKPATFELRLVPKIIQSSQNDFGGRIIRGEVAVVFTNTETNLSNNWDYDRFTERLVVMRELYTKYMATGEFPIVNQDLDPFYESPEVYRRIGQASISLQSLCYLFPVEGPVSVLANSGEVVCNLNLLITPIVMVYDTKGVASPMQSPHSVGSVGGSSGSFPFPQITGSNISLETKGENSNPRLTSIAEGGSDVGPGSRRGSKLNPAVARVRSGVSPMAGRGRAMSFMENPDDLIGKRMDVNIEIQSVDHNSSDFLNGVYVRFKFWGMDDDIETEPSLEKGTKVALNHKTPIRVDPVTNQFLSYLSNENLMLDVFANAGNIEDTRRMLNQMDDDSEEEEMEIAMSKLHKSEIVRRDSSSMAFGLSRDASPRIRRAGSSSSPSRSDGTGARTSVTPPSTTAGTTARSPMSVQARKSNDTGGGDVGQSVFEPTLSMASGRQTISDPSLSRPNSKYIAVVDGEGDGEGRGGRRGKKMPPIKIKGMNEGEGDREMNAIQPIPSPTSTIPVVRVTSSSAVVASAVNGSDGVKGEGEGVSENEQKMHTREQAGMVHSASDGSEEATPLHQIFRHDDFEAELAARRIQAVVRGNIVRNAQRQREAEAEAARKKEKEKEEKKNESSSHSVEAELEALRKKMKELEDENKRLASTSSIDAKVTSRHRPPSPKPPNRRVITQRDRISGAGFSFLSPEARRAAKGKSRSMDSRDEGKTQACEIL